MHQYPKLLRKEASVSILQSRDHILNTYSETISQYAESRFERHGIHTIVNARVREVGKDYVKYATKDKEGKVTEFTIPSGFTLWSTGIGELSRCCYSTQRVTDLLLSLVSYEPFYQAYRFEIA